MTSLKSHLDLAHIASQPENDLLDLHLLSLLAATEKSMATRHDGSDLQPLIDDISEVRLRTRIPHKLILQFLDPLSRGSVKSALRQRRPPPETTLSRREARTYPLQASQGCTIHFRRA
jgi:hypothetical protein